MILIAHRGNINGPGEYENGQKYCQEAIDAGTQILGGLVMINHNIESILIFS
jgi:hypothetical protein